MAGGTGREGGCNISANRDIMTPPPVTISGELCEGYFKTKLVKNGPEAVCHVFYGYPPDPVTGETLDRRPRWMVTVNGLLVDACLFNAEDRDGVFIWRVMQSHRITKEQHDIVAKDAAWAREHAPGLPEANPWRPIDLKHMASIF